MSESSDEENSLLLQPKGDVCLGTAPDIDIELLSSLKYVLYEMVTPWSYFVGRGRIIILLYCFPIIFYFYYLQGRYSLQLSLINCSCCFMELLRKKGMRNIYGNITDSETYTKSICASMWNRKDEMHNYKLLSRITTMHSRFKRSSTHNKNRGGHSRNLRERNTVVECSSLIPCDYTSRCANHVLKDIETLSTNTPLPFGIFLILYTLWIIYQWNVNFSWIHFTFTFYLDLPCFVCTAISVLVMTIVLHNVLMSSYGMISTGYLCVEIFKCQRILSAMIGNVSVEKYGIDGVQLDCVDDLIVWWELRRYILYKYARHIRTSHVSIVVTFAFGIFAFVRGGFPLDGADAGIWFSISLTIIMSISPLLFFMFAIYALLNKETETQIKLLNMRASDILLLRREISGHKSNDQQSNSKALCEISIQEKLIDRFVKDVKTNTYMKASFCGIVITMELFLKLIIGLSTTYTILSNTMLKHKKIHTAQMHYLTYLQNGTCKPPLYQYIVVGPRVS